LLLCLQWISGISAGVGTTAEGTCLVRPAPPGGSLPFIGYRSLDLERSQSLAWKLLALGRIAIKTTLLELCLYIFYRRALRCCAVIWVVFESNTVQVQWWSKRITTIMEEVADTTTPDLQTHITEINLQVHVVFLVNSSLLKLVPNNIWTVWLGKRVKAV